MEYTSKRDRYENLSPEEYLNVIRPYLRDLTNEHKPTVELNVMMIVITIIIIITIIRIIIIIIIIMLIEQNGKFSKQCKTVVYLLDVLKKHALYTQKVNQ